MRSKELTLVQKTFKQLKVLLDADMAHEMVDFTKNQILNQAGNAMLAQANTRSQGVMQLLQ